MPIAADKAAKDPETLASILERRGMDWMLSKLKELTSDEAIRDKLTTAGVDCSQH